MKIGTCRSQKKKARLKVADGRWRATFTVHGRVCRVVVDVDVDVVAKRIGLLSWLSPLLQHALSFSNGQLSRKLG
jgi:hypothetical protein